MTKVSIRACESYDYDVFRKSFEKMIEDIYTYWDVICL